MSSQPIDSARLAAAWDQFCDQLKLAGKDMFATGCPGDVLTQAEGIRYLTRLLRLSLEKNLEFSDPHYPQFYSLSHETAKIGNDNPDNFYQNCAIDGGCEYRIRGNRGTVEYLSIETKAGSFASGGDMAPTGHVEIDQLLVDPEGNFELMVSATPHTGNWLPMTADSDNLLVRQTFRNRRTEQVARLGIECLSPRAEPVLDAGEFVHSLEQVAPFVSGTAGLFRQWMDVFSSHINQLPPNDQQMCLRAGGDPSIHYHNSYWRLAAHEALLIQFSPPKEARSWNFQLSNYWMESLDYRHHRISLNSSSAQVGADGRVHIVVAHSDPGPAYPNWLTTAGHEVGAMLLRYIEARDFPPVDTAVIALAQLHKK